MIEKQWGKAWKRFAIVLIMGGGAVLLENSLPYRFNGRAYVPDEPVQAIARGLYRLTLLQQARKGKQMARGRPVFKGQSWDCQVHMRLRVGEDDDLIAFLQHIPARRRVSAIKSALRSGKMNSTWTDKGEADDDLLPALDDFLK